LKYKVIDTLAQYDMLLDSADKENYFCYTMMKPFEKMWELLNVPMKAKSEGGYDVLMATEMLGYLEVGKSEQIQEAISILREHDILEVLDNTVKHCIEKALEAGLYVNADELAVGLYLADSKKAKLTNGYGGFGGIPGYVTLNLYPNAYNLARVPALFAHEFHHNIRFSHVDWNHGNVSVGDYLVIEGLAESFAKELYGEECLGPWVTSMDSEDLAYSLYVIGEALDVKGFSEVSAYMFGDELAKQQGYAPVGLSFCAGYGVGYAVVQAFLKNSGKTIFEATLLDSGEIIAGSRLFEGG